MSIKEFRERQAGWSQACLTYPGAELRICRTLLGCVRDIVWACSGARIDAFRLTSPIVAR